MGGNVDGRDGVVLSGTPESPGRTGLPRSPSARRAGIGDRAAFSGPLKAGDGGTHSLLLLVSGPLLTAAGPETSRMWRCSGNQRLLSRTRAWGSQRGPHSPQLPVPVPVDLLVSDLLGMS